MQHSDLEIADILRQTKVIACVGLSLNPARPSYNVAEFMTAKGTRVIGVNPGQAGKTAFGEVIYASLADIPADVNVDMVDIFRRSDAVPGIVEAALTSLPGLKTIWMQLGITHDAAAQTARDAGMTVVQNRCPKIEWDRLLA